MAGYLVEHHLRPESTQYMGLFQDEGLVGKILEKVQPMTDLKEAVEEIGDKLNEYGKKFFGLK